MGNNERLPSENYGIFQHIFKYVTETLKCCDLCQHVITYKNIRVRKTLHPILVPLKVSSQIGIDLIGPLKESDGYRYIVTAVDYTSKFVEVEPLKENTSKSVAKSLYILLCQYVPCGTYIRDQERELVNTFTETFYNLTGMYYCITFSYHLQVNGLV